MRIMEGRELRERRIALGLTQARLAEILDVKPNTVARWERGILVVPKYIALAIETVEREYKKRTKRQASKKSRK
ncbi:MAG TPA: helix-turn-helix domain-containing protein [Pyrinomonadaceae bacterium]|jgi:transcriptional regulator with XRE-family HTH domain